MQTLIPFFLSFFLSLSLQATFAPVQIIDTFQISNDVLLIQLDNSAPPSVLVFNSANITSEGALGGERDLILTVEAGTIGSVLSCSVSDGSLSIATATNSVGIVTLQYDGVDNSSVVNASGLGGINLKDKFGTAFMITALSDHPTLMTVRVYSGEGFVSQSVVTTEAGSLKKNYVLSFTSFSGNADFSNVGAIELEIKASIALDAVVYSFGTISNRVYLTAPLEAEHYNFDRSCKVSSSEVTEEYEDSDLTTLPSNSTSSSTTSKVIGVILDSYALFESSGKWVLIPSDFHTSTDNSNSISRVGIISSHQLTQSSASSIVCSIVLLCISLLIV